MGPSQVPNKCRGVRAIPFTLRTEPVEIMTMLSGSRRRQLRSNWTSESAAGPWVAWTTTQTRSPQTDLRESINDEVEADGYQ